MTLGEIIKKYRTDNDMSMDTFSEKSGISKAYISLLEKNKHPKTGEPITPSINIIKQAAKGMMISFDSLFSMINGDVNLSDVQSETKGIKISVYGKVSAGIPIEMIEDIIDTEEIPIEMAKTGEFFGLQIHGDSMEPRMKEGDVVIVKKQEDAESGDVVIATVNGDEATCKRLRKYRDGIELIANNPNYEPLFFSNEEIEKKPVCIIGKVVELRGKGNF